jgi:hypothetical protein
MKLKVIVFGLVVLFASAVVCAAQSPHMGTWKLNDAKSKFPKGATKNHTVVYEAAGDQTKSRSMGLPATAAPCTASGPANSTASLMR